MNRKVRTPLGFGEELDQFDPAEWNRAGERRRPEGVALAAEAAGFQSREAAPKQGKVPKIQRRRRTGRNTQFNIKTRQETIDKFISIADKHGWGIGETFEKATELLSDKYDSLR